AAARRPRRRSRERAAVGGAGRLATRLHGAGRLHLGRAGLGDRDGSGGRARALARRPALRARRGRPAAPLPAVGRVPVTDRELAEAAARRAGDLLLARFGDAHDYERKSDAGADVVSDADREAEAVVVALLREE